jgi:PAS domain-containing protein
MLQVAFDAATEAMLIVDAERQVHWANQAAAELLPWWRPDPACQSQAGRPHGPET